MPASSIEQTFLAQLTQQGFHMRSFRQRRLGAHPVFEISLAGGQTVLIQRLFESETALLRWLSSHSAVPAPHLLHVLPSSAEIPGNAFTHTRRCPSWAKEQLVRSYADFALKLFDIDIPQTIGSISVTSSTDELVVIPRICSANHAHAPGVFPTLQKYLEYLSTLKKRRAFTSDTGEESRFRAQASISQLIAHLRGHLTQLDERCVRRMVLAHDGLGDMNFMVDSSGNITGILDWWRNSTLPAILAADYPPWLRYDGINDPRFAAPSKSWLETQEESARLRRIYQGAVKSNDFYYTALMQGAQLRAAVGWVFDIEDDPCCVRMRQWTLSTFGPPIGSPSNDNQCIIT
ncbi:hypothetical protein DFJ58DRAFT_810101 [Suillus subalutaceus]|uniref:uncharacterized protein n=1 Tax=Suillus subalutaceus TaxID=48586 RepID=UPI001B865B40|nr:uncharacterized protein DFJ58DRAFT_810101 [Suillus subalutaceus]KAG1840730.1 hypothetical protein DFJ58DRAFT_810101 [Suillus subalutaceus]